MLALDAPIGMVSLPDVLFSQGSEVIVEGSVVILFCEVTSIPSNPTVTWTKDDMIVVQDVPHFVIRKFDVDITTTLQLVVYDFGSSDNGEYQCIAELGGNMGMGNRITLTGIILLKGTVL